MTRSPLQRIRAVLTRGQTLFEKARQSEIRTQAFFDDTLTYLYEFYYELRGKDELIMPFRALARAKGFRQTNDALSLIKMTYCAKLPPVGSRARKNELTKASNYAGKLNRANAADVTPSEFRHFLQRERLQGRSKLRTQRQASGQIATATAVHSQGQTSKRLPALKYLVRTDAVSSQYIELGFVAENVYRAFCEILHSATTHNAVCTIRRVGGKSTVIAVRKSAKGLLRPFPFRLNQAGRWVHITEAQSPG